MAGNGRSRSAMCAATPVLAVAVKNPASDADRARLDVWLWRARFFKARSQAAAAVEAGRVRLLRGGASSVAPKPSVSVKPGDGLVVIINRRIVTLTVRAVGERRGPPAEARLLYELSSPDHPSDVDEWGDDPVA